VPLSSQAHFSFNTHSLLLYTTFPYTTTNTTTTLTCVYFLLLYRLHTTHFTHLHTDWLLPTYTTTFTLHTTYTYTDDTRFDDVTTHSPTYLPFTHYFVTGDYYTGTPRTTSHDLATWHQWAFLQTQTNPKSAGVNTSTGLPDYVHWLHFYLRLTYTQFFFNPNTYFPPKTLTT